MSAHTPGPWAVDGPLNLIGTTGKCFAIDGNGLTVATIGANDPDLAPALADANLIAASPDLLASVEEILAAFDRQVAEYRATDSEAIALIAEQVHGKRMARARAAIAKARGGR